MELDKNLIHIEHLQFWEQMIF